MVHDHILERGGTFRERGAALRALINAFAYQEGVPVSEYVREMVHDHILQRGARFRETGARLRVLSNAVKAWLIAYHECVAVAAGLPGKERRAELVSRIHVAIAFRTPWRFRFRGSATRKENCMCVISRRVKSVCAKRWEWSRSPASYL